MKKKWLIISWKHDDLMDGAYGRHIDDFEGTYEDAAIYARQFVPNCSPVGVVGVIDAPVTE